MVDCRLARAGLVVELGAVGKLNPVFGQRLFIATTLVGFIPIYEFKDAE